MDGSNITILSIDSTNLFVDDILEECLSMAGNCIWCFTDDILCSYENTRICGKMAISSECLYQVLSASGKIKNKLYFQIYGNSGTIKIYIFIYLIFRV